MRHSKFIASLLILVTILSFVACQPTSNTPTKGTEQTKDITTEPTNQTDEIISVTSISLDITEKTILESGAAKLIATVLPENASNKEVVWESSNSTIATVNDGVVLGISEGTATITVTSSDGNFSATCLITVEAKAIEPDPTSDPTAEPTIVECTHENTFVANQKSPSCIEKGYTGDTYCLDCSVKLFDGEEIGIIDHNYIDGYCTMCHEKDPDYIFDETPVIGQKELVDATYSYKLIKSSTKSAPKYTWYEITANYNEEAHKFIVKFPVVPSCVYGTKAEKTAVKETMDKQINLINQMASSKANVNVWLYIARSFETTEFMVDENLPTGMLLENLDYFEKGLSDDVWVGYYEPADIEEWIQMYYATDHHYSAYGMAVAYKQIENALKTKYDDIVSFPATEHKTDATFYGSNARSTQWEEFKDTFTYFDYHLPNHSITLLTGDNDDKPTKKVPLDKGGYILYGSETPCEENYSKYCTGTYNKNENYDHYINMYPICDTITYPDNNTGRNLLIIGDSFSLGLQELLAANFDKTYVLYSDATVYLYGSTDFYKYCTQNKITDVIILEQDTRIMYDYFDYSGKALVNFYVSK